MKQILLSAVISLLSFGSIAQTLEDDRLALVAFYYSTGGHGWFTQQRPDDYPAWQVPGKPGDNPCGWEGITCEGDRVTGIVMGGNDMEGTIPREIGNLTALKLLVLSSQSNFFYWRVLRGPIPTSISNLVNLETLVLDGNIFETIEPIFTLPRLKTLSFSAHRSVSSSIGNLGQLESLTISYPRSLTARESILKIPSEIGNLSKLKTLHLAAPFNGYVPSELSKLSDLTSLHIEGTGVSGYIPPEIGKLSKLTDLVISGNRIRGPIPDEVGDLTNLKYLRISDLNLGGSIPSSLGNLINLESLNLSSNAHTGNIPAFFAKLVNLTYLDLASNALTGTIPASFNGLTQINAVRLDQNNLTSPIPDLSALRSRRFWIGGNKFTFDGLESNENRFAAYANQQKIPLIKSNNTLSVNAGGTLSRNTYRWYNYETLVATRVGDNTFTPTESGRYHVEVTNSIATILTLVSESLENSLPVTLTSFTGLAQNARNKLTWTTASETNNKGFEIEKSSNGIAFEKVGFVDGGGDRNENKTYHFTDLNPGNLTYYRLKQIDYDGGFEHSKIIAVKNEQELSIYPNPAQDNFSVLGLESQKQLTIFDQRGDKVLIKQINPATPVNVQMLSPGSYTLKIGERTKKLVIQK